MSTTRNRWLSAAQGAAWFQLTRHDDPEPEPETEGEPVPEEPADDPDPDGADKLGDAGKKALEAMKAQRAEAKRAAAAEKKRADELARRVAEFEDRDKSELERVTSKAEEAEKRAAAATERAVKAEVKALASDFADIEDALLHLGGKLADYVDASGDIDTDAIEADLAGVLERKPHLKRAAVEPEKKTPRPDPGQGARPPVPPTDYRTADRAEVDAELAKLAPGFRIRS